MNRYTKAEEHIAKQAVKATLEEIIKFIDEDIEPSSDRIGQAHFRGESFKSGFDYCKEMLVSQLEEHIREINE